MESDELIELLNTNNFAMNENEEEIVLHHVYELNDNESHEFVPVSIIDENFNQNIEEHNSARVLDVSPVTINEVTVEVTKTNDDNLEEIRIEEEIGKKKWTRKQRKNNEEMPFKVLTRKRQVNEKNWMKNKRKILRQSGKDYNSAVKAAKCSAKAYRYRNCTLCKFKCNQLISEEQAQTIFKEFWTLDDNEKGHFYDKTTKRLLKQRTRPENAESVRPRTFSFQYYFVINNEKFRVCKAFYLDILAVSQRRISYFHNVKKTGVTQTPTRDKRGTKTKKRIPEEERQHIRDHINAFPRVDGHYCRKNTKKQYLEEGLNLNKLYDLYIKWCNEQNYKPQKKWLYDNVFNNEFNIGFYIPKKDQCDTCHEHQAKTSQFFVLQAEELQLFEKHIQEKEYARIEKQKDRESLSQKRVVLCFDMQRVLNCPQSSISVFYYSRKFSLYNLTGYDLNMRQGYCILWHEGISGRDGNDIASATVKLVQQILTSHHNNPVEELVLWSGACVPQNRNSFMATALLELLNQDGHSLKTIHQKFQEPGHSCVQEVDSIHSIIDRHLDRLEIHSPLAMVRCLLSVRAKKKFKVTQLRPALFKDYKSIAKTYNALDKVPFSKIKHIIYTKNSEIVQYKTSFNEDIFKKVNFKTSRVSTRKRANELPPTPKAPINKKNIIIPAMKKQDIFKLYKFFSDHDKIFWDSVLK